MGKPMKKFQRFMAACLIGVATVALGLTLNGVVIARRLVHNPPPPPGYTYIDRPGDMAEMESVRPFWLTFGVLSVLLSASAAFLVRNDFSVLTTTTGLSNPVTLVLGLFLYVMSPWQHRAQAGYQLPAFPLLILCLPIIVFFTSSVMERFAACRGRSVTG
jgi:hypothetical protein